jgi:hypothetical protein
MVRLENVALTIERKRKSSKTTTDRLIGGPAQRQCCRAGTKKAENRVVTELLASLQAMETFYQHKMVAVPAQQNRVCWSTSRMLSAIASTTLVASSCSLLH